ncbi:MAG: type II toxin-antitoxin system HicA family toxin [Chloroflexi bacterium]|nr:type II toxin-antitoxin system HicA family toxin [Chloroflexota bacterium]
MTYTELTKRLKQLGCEFKREGKGSHEVWWHPQRRRITTIPHHGNRDIKEGTLRKVLRDLEIGREEWEQLK